MAWKISVVMWYGLLAAALVCSSAAMAQGSTVEPAPAGLVAIRAHCAECHREISAGAFDRISQERKTPEGWAATIFRMRQVHEVQVTPADQAAIIEYLSAVQGLAPSEVQAGHYALERWPNAPDLKLPNNLNAVCGRCHSVARIVLQRRDAAEWLKLSKMP